MRIPSATRIFTGNYHYFRMNSSDGALATRHEIQLARMDQRHRPADRKLCRHRGAVAAGAARHGDCGRGLSALVERRTDFRGRGFSGCRHRQDYRDTFHSRGAAGQP